MSDMTSEQLQKWIDRFPGTDEEWGRLEARFIGELGARNPDLVARSLEEVRAHRAEVVFALAETLDKEKRAEAVEIDEADLLVYAFRDKPDDTLWLPVRIVHVPTGTVVVSRSCGSVHMNRADAMRKLKLCLADLDKTRVKRLSGLPRPDPKYRDTIDKA